MAGAISAGEAKRRVHGADEIAFLDIRDAVPFASGHPLLAAPCPVGRFDADLRWLAPRRNCPVLLVDGGDGTAAEAADRMAAFGYCDVSWIEGGVQAWADAGYTLYEGVGSVESIDTAMKLGANHPMGPLELGDFIGLDTILAIMNVLYDGLADSKYRPCPLLVKYVEAGWLGRKSGRGFYDYRGDKPVPTR